MAYPGPRYLLVVLGTVVSSLRAYFVPGRLIGKLVLWYPTTTSVGT